MQMYIRCKIGNLLFNIKPGCRFLLYIIKSLFYSSEVLQSQFTWEGWELQGTAQSLRGVQVGLIPHS